MKKALVFSLYIIFILYTCRVPVKANILPEISSTPMTTIERQKNSYLCELEYLSKPKDRYSNILQIAVNQTETEIALSMSNYTIEIYDTKGNYKYGFKTNAGQGIALEYDLDNKLCIYLVRSKIIFKIDVVGKIINMEWVNNTEQNKDYCHLLVNRTELTKENNTYFLDGSMGVNNKCIVSSLEGEYILVDHGNQAIISFVIFPVLTFLIGMPIIILIVITIKRKRQETKIK